jgi:hypothetical protein
MLEVYCLFALKSLRRFRSGVEVICVYITRVICGQSLWSLLPVGYFWL